MALQYFSYTICASSLESRSCGGASPPGQTLSGMKDFLNREILSKLLVGAFRLALMGRHLGASRCQNRRICLFFRLVKQLQLFRRVQDHFRPFAFLPINRFLEPRQLFLQPGRAFSSFRLDT